MDLVLIVILAVMVIDRELCQPFVTRLLVEKLERCFAGLDRAERCWFAVDIAIALISQQRMEYDVLGTL
jgi:hypothetical protein